MVKKTKEVLSFDNRKQFASFVEVLIQIDKRVLLVRNQKVVQAKREQKSKSIFFVILILKMYSIEHQV